jgi:DNA-binding GntR family transcriptional regulator
LSKGSHYPKDSFAYEQIKKLVVERRLIPGQKILYRDLEEMLCVSKTPIVNALGRLENEHIVVSFHNRGYYMREWTKEHIRQMFDLKEKVHQIVVDYAVKNRNPENFAKLNRAVTEYLKYRTKTYDLKKYKLDWQFHVALSEMSGNEYLVSIIDQQYFIMSYTIDLSALTPLLKRFEKEHFAIYKAISKGNIREAKAILREHDEAGKRLLG